MVSSSSSEQEFQTANPSQERDDAPIASTGDYRPVYQDSVCLQPLPANNYVCTLQDPASSTRLPLPNTSREVDVTVPRSAMTRGQRHPELSARAPAFVPLARPQRGAVKASEEGRSPESHAYPTSTSPPGRLIYDNQVARIPSHWIPIYGSGHGIFYDPVTKLFYNDGYPRPALERRDGRVQPVDASMPTPRMGLQREDVIHVHPPSFTAPITEAMEDNPSAIERYYCRCRDAWLAHPHDCPDEGEVDEESAGEAPASKATPGAIRPSDTIPLESMTHGLAVGDLSYMTPQQRHTHGYSERMPMSRPGMAGMVVVPLWMHGGKQRRISAQNMWSGLSC